MIEPRPHPHDGIHDRKGIPRSLATRDVRFPPRPLAPEDLPSSEATAVRSFNGLVGSDRPSVRPARRAGPSIAPAGTGDPRYVPHSLVRWPDRGPSPFVSPAHLPAGAA